MTIMEFKGTCISEAIESIAIENLDYKEVRINPRSFKYFVATVGAQIRVFGHWNTGRTCFNYNDGIIDINFYIDKTVPAEVAYFIKDLDVIRVELSG